MCIIIDTVKEKCLWLSIVGIICVDCSSGQIDPMANARAKGHKIGGPQVTADDTSATILRRYLEVKAGKTNLSELAKISGLSRMSAN